MKIFRILKHASLILAVVAVAMLWPSLGGCSSHDTSSPHQALLGHWKVKDTRDKTNTWDDIYFSASTVYYQEGTGQTSIADRYQNQYSVEAETKNPFSLKIRYVYTDVKTGKPVIARKTIVFSADKTEMSFKANTDTRESKEEAGPYSYSGTETKP